MLTRRQINKLEEIAITIVENLRRCQVVEAQSLTLEWIRLNDIICKELLLATVPRGTSNFAPCSTEAVAAEPSIVSTSLPDSSYSVEVVSRRAACEDSSIGGFAGWDQEASTIADRSSGIVVQSSGALGKDSTTSTPIETPRCYCNHPSIMLTSSKEATFGSRFFKCATGICRFFQWEDPDVIVQMNQSRIAPLAPDAERSDSDYLPGTRDPREEIRTRFGHAGFREGQFECVDAALRGRDVFCLMPTGGGKSIVYQVRLLHWIPVSGGFMRTS